MSSKNLARLVIDLSYVVDVNDPDMIEHARSAIYEDVYNLIKTDELAEAITLQDVDPTLTEEDIPEFLLEGQDEGYEY
jgi:hypothetical protein